LSYLVATKPKLNGRYSRRTERGVSLTCVHASPREGRMARLRLANDSTSGRISSGCDIAFGRSRERGRQGAFIHQGCAEGRVVRWRETLRSWALVANPRHGPPTVGSSLVPRCASLTSGNAQALTRHFWSTMFLLIHGL
jgi:hypothetical protein